jgi:hypothetical protein
MNPANMNPSQPMSPLKWSPAVDAQMHAMSSRLPRLPRRLTAVPQEAKGRSIARGLCWGVTAL